MVNLITEHMDVWTTAKVKKSNGGRGRGNNSNGQSNHGIKKLRELILELAVRGKLVSQDPKDEPASVLLEKIAKERTRLIKEGKIKKQKPLPEIGEDEKLFELPNGWEWARLQDVSTYIQRGKGPKYADQGNVQVISQKCIQWFGFDLSKARYVDDDSLNKYQHERFLQTNDLLWNSTGTGTVGRINILREVDPCSLVADSHVTVIRPLQVNSDFIRCYIAAPDVQLRIEPQHDNSLVSGTTNQVELNTSAVQPLLVPIPPLAEQHRIVAKVDELMALCDLLERQQTDSNETHQTLVETLLGTLTNAADQRELAEAWQRIASHFDALFTTEQSIDLLKQTILQLAVMGKLIPQDPNDEPASVLLEKIGKENKRLVKERKIKKQKKMPEISEHEKLFNAPNGWAWARFSQLINPEYPISYGVLVPGPNVPNGVPFVRIGDLDLKNPTASPEKSIDKEIDKKYERTRLLGGEILMGVVGSIGKLGIVPDSWRGANIARAICRIVASKFIYKPYLIWLLQSELMQNGFLGDTRTLAQPTLNIGFIRNAPTPLPPIREQHRIVAKIDELMVLCDLLREYLVKNKSIQVQLADAIVEHVAA